MADDLRAFWKALATNWLAAMSGGLSVPLMIVGVLWPAQPWRSVLGLTGIAALCWAAFKIWQREHRALAALQIGPSMPDWSIHDAFFGLDPTVIDDLKTEKWEDVGSRLLDLLSTGQIIGWGREVERLSRRRLPLTKIPAEYWQGARFTYWFLKDEDEVSTHVESSTGVGHNEYADLYFNRNALEAAWRQQH